MHKTSKIKKQVVLILGMHRSGTSVAARIVQSLGFNLGTQLLEPNSENPKGFFENQEIVSFNDRLLRHMSLSWDSIGFIWDEDFDNEYYREFFLEAKHILIDNFSDTEMLAIKDPRFCILLPFWQKVIHHFCHTDIAYIFCLRNPLESYLSQKKRSEVDPSFHIIGTDKNTFFMFWYTYMRKAAGALDSDRCLCVSYENLISEPAKEYKRFAKFLDIVTNSRIIEEFSESFIEASLRHHKINEDVFLKSCREFNFIVDLYNGLKLKDSIDTISKSEMQRLKESTAKFNDLSRLYLLHAQRLYGKLYHQHLLTRRDLIDIGNQNETRKLEIEELKSSLDTIQNLYDQNKHRLEESEYEISELKTNFYELTDKYNVVVNSLRWRVISMLCRFLRR